MNFMKFFSMLAIVFGCFTANALAFEKHEPRIQKKYIKSEDIVFQNNQMYVFANSQWITTNAIFTDADGFYIDEAGGTWTCPRCHTVNKDKITCDNCGFQR